MSLLLNMLSRLVIAFLLRSKRLLISWLQSPATGVLEPPKIKSVTISTVSSWHTEFEIPWNLQMFGIAMERALELKRKGKILFIYNFFKGCFNHWWIRPLVTQMVKNPLAVQKIWVWSLGQEDLLEKGMATQSSIRRIPWTEEPGGIQSFRLQRVRHNWVTNTSFFNLI